MARIKVTTPFDSVQKMFSKTDEIHFKNRKADNAKFAAVSRLVAARAIDPTKMDDDAVAFRNQSKYTTMRGFLFAEEWANYAG